MEEFQLEFQNQVLVESVKVYITGPTLQTRCYVNLAPRSFMVLNAKAQIDRGMEGGLYKVVPNSLLMDEYQELVLMSTIHNVEVSKTQCILFVVLNLPEEEISLNKEDIVGHLEQEDTTVEEITTGTMLQNMNIEPEIGK